MKSLVRTLMDRDGIEKEEAEKAIEIARDELYSLMTDGLTEEAYDICMEHFGLEPDYLLELL